MKKRVLSLLLCITMLLTMGQGAAISAWAETNISKETKAETG